ncbi:MAG: hypothetical protein NDJ92_13950 [Thermoanaerobaculia bacterium]|nr:hypothetical protein [Thermoanaerobaculia bacterium]
MRLRRQLPVVLIIDVEPDERTIRQPADWRGFEESVELFQGLRRQLESRTGTPVHFSWFVRMDPQIESVYGDCSWAAGRNRELFDAIEAHGDELGLHVHSWKWSEADHDWVAEYADQAWVETCVRKGAAAFEESFGRPCRSFRFGDHWMNESTIQLLEDLGIRYDLTLEPGQTGSPYARTKEKFSGWMPDYRAVWRSPFRPARANYLRRYAFQRRDIWLLPISTGFLPAASLGLPKNARPICIALNLCFTPDAFGYILRKSSTNGWLAPVARTDVTIRHEQKKDCEENFRLLLKLATTRDCRFVTPAELIAAR